MTTTTSKMPIQVFCDALYLMNDKGSWCELGADYVRFTFSDEYMAEAFLEIAKAWHHNVFGEKKPRLYARKSPKSDILWVYDVTVYC